MGWNNGVLAFSRLHKFKIRNGSRVPEESTLFQRYLQIYHSLNSKIKNCDQLFILLNQNVHSWYIVHLERDYLPAPASKEMTFKIAYNFNQRELKHFRNMFEKLPKSTKVHLRIYFFSWHNPNFIETLQMAFEVR